MKITVWSYRNDDNATIHNHIETGWVKGNYPKPRRADYINQRSWKNMKWTKRHAYLVNNIVVNI